MGPVVDATQEDLQVFLQEADEQLQFLDEDIVRLEKEPSNPELLQEIFRISHTLKGSSAMLGYRSMTELAHAMESVLDKLRKATLTATRHVIDALLHSLDALKKLRDRLASPKDGDVDISAAVAELESACKGGPVPTSTSPTLPDVPAVIDQMARDRLQALLGMGQNAYKVKVALRQDTPWAAVRCFQVIAALSGQGEVVYSSPSQKEIEQEKATSYIEVFLASKQDPATLAGLVTAVEEVTTAEVTPYLLEAVAAAGKTPSPEDAVARKPALLTQTVRVDVERLDSLMNSIGEMVIDRTRVAQIARLLERKYGEDELVKALGQTSAHVGKVVDNIQTGAMKMRMLPVGTVFSGFPRMVRDLSQKANKKVDLVIQGQDTEIDRTVIEHIRDPLVHLLRNAVDHGIEPPDKRIAAGKPEAGVIKLAAFQEQGHIVITVEDDGRGIDPVQVKEATLRKGLITPEAASSMSEPEAINLIFLPGASTAEKATEVSGRGVGMDIVRTNIEAINGFVFLDTKVGSGTKFTLSLPLTLATLPALLFSLSQTVYAVPLVYVIEAVKLEPGSVNTVGGNEVIRLRGNVLPLLRLGSVLGMGARKATEIDKAFAIVVRFGKRLVALVVDSLTESQEIVVKSLGRYVGDVKGIAGASILGDGRVVLILDVPSLLNTSVAR